MRRVRLRPAGERRAGPVLRGGAALAFVAAGALFATSHVDADGTQLRSARSESLSDVVAQRKVQVDRLTARNQRLRAEIRTLSRAAQAPADSEQTAVLTRLRAQAGLTPASGAGVRVLLDDAPDRVIESLPQGGPVTVTDLIVHQQDIQAVANALWKGGATAMTIQGQRVVSTTGIKCVGNTVILHGVPYSPPYDIAAIGDPTSLRAAVEGSRYVGYYREVADRYELGFSLDNEPELQMPAFRGGTDLRYARR